MKCYSCCGKGAILAQGTHLTERKDHHSIHQQVRGCAGILASVCLVSMLTAGVSAQQPEPGEGDGRVQYPSGLANSFVTVSAGYIGYASSQEQLEPGHQAGSIEVPHAAARVVLFGHNFGDHFAVQGSYMRPIKYVRYRNLDGSDATHTVWMHFGTVTAQTR